MTTDPRTSPVTRRQPAHSAWIPRQHGAWAMLLVPVLLGVAASTASPWQLAVGGVALAAYLASASLQAWSRGRRPPAYQAPIAVYGSIAAVLGALLLVRFPAIALAAVVVVPASILVFRGARPGTRRDLVNSLAQVAQALVLVPVAAWVSGAWDPERVIAYTGIAAAYQLGTVLVVRSVLRERGNHAFRILSAGFHVAVTIVAAVTLPVPWAILGAALTARAIALPRVQDALAAGPSPLRPVHVGIVEIVASLAVVAVALLAAALRPG